MKKLFFGAAIIAAGLFSTANAQIQRGNWMVGGDMIGSSFGLNSYGGYNMQIEPKLGYFVKNNFALGGYGNLGINKAQKSNGVSTKAVYSYGLGAFGRYYFSDNQVDNLLKHGRFFLEGNLGFAGSSQKGGQTTNGLGFGAGPGYAYFITSNIGLEALVKYQGITGFGNRGLQSNLLFNLGLQIYLPTAKSKQIINDVN